MRLFLGIELEDAVTAAAAEAARALKTRLSTAAPEFDARWVPRPNLHVTLWFLGELADPEADDRDVVDLLWFPTGGGKTEAYLAIAAFQILLRRLRSGDRGAGTTVITRYTLRLLTAQQFQRATTVVCALELLRQSYQDEMGREPISIGLWVGVDQAPNTLAKAREIACRY